MVDFECSGDEQTQENAVPDGMKMIEVKMPVISRDIPGRDPSRCNGLELFAAHGGLQSQSLQGAHLMQYGPDDYLGGEINNGEEGNENIRL